MGVRKRLGGDRAEAMCPVAPAGLHGVPIRSPALEAPPPEGPNGWTEQGAAPDPQGWEERMRTTSILLVDSDPEALRQLADILKLLGFGDLHTAASANAAWNLLRMKRFACVFCAWNMPQMNGLALLQIVRGDDRMVDLPYYLSDTTITQEKVIEAGRASVTGLVVKPYQFAVIKNKVERIGEPQSSFIPQEVQDWMQEAETLLEQGKNVEALKAFERLLAEGESAEIYYNIGYIKTAQGEFTEAIEAFRRATELDRLFAKAYEAMGRAYKRLGKSREAEECLNKAAEIYLNSQQEAKAKEILDEIIQEDPTTINVFNTLGVLHRKRGDYAQAIDAYKRALRIHPDEPYIHYNIGHIYVAVKNLKQAKESFQKAVSLDPSFPEAREALDVLLQKGV